MALGQVGGTFFHYRNSRRTKQRTSVASVSLATIYDVQWKLMMLGMSKAEKDKPSDKHCQMQGLDFPFGWTLLRM
jgi:hypothetical protein